MKIRELEEIMSAYGDISIGEIIKKKKGNNKYKCPKCEGNGFTTKLVDMYPSGLPDSGWATDMKPVYSDCDLCNGIGYTSRQLKPKTETKIIGYE